VDFAELVRDCVEVARVRNNLQPESLRFETSAQMASVRIMGDPEELRTAVSNLLDNAVKYSGGQVDVAARVEILDEKRVRLSIRDQGVGIAPAELKRIFKRFYRVSNRALAHVKGTGLGLFIVRAIANRHGGRVFAQSAGEGRGTTMILELPWFASQPDAARENVPQREAI
jgi:signal transduction histidine kinase